MNRREALVQKLLSEKRKDSLAKVASVSVEIPASRNGFLDLVYGSNWISTGDFPGHCADKLLFSDLIRAVSPLAHDRFHPATFGVREFLERENKDLLNGPILIKAVDGMNTDGRGIQHSWSEFLKHWRDEGETVSTLTGLLSSGESHMIQASVGASDNELRLHTWEGSVIKGATYTRWDQPWDLAWFSEAEDALQDFLNLLPTWFVARQAWSIDLMGRCGSYKIIEINSNRGLAKHWSGDLSLPDTLQAYVLFLEKAYGLRFAGASGDLLREGRANEDAFHRKFGSSAVRRHHELKKSIKTDR